MPRREDIYFNISHQKHQDELIKKLTDLVETLTKEVESLKIQLSLKSPENLNNDLLKYDDETYYVIGEREPKKLDGKKVWYEWEIPEFKKYLNRAKDVKNYFFIQSKPFYLESGYRIVLIIHPYGHLHSKSKYISFYYAIYPGDNDDKLTWPFKLRNRLAIVDQLNDSLYENKMQILGSFKQIYKKPENNQRNCSIGFEDFLSLKKFESNTSLWQKGCVKVRIYFTSSILPL